jgi:hypothetical protein
VGENALSFILSWASRIFCVLLRATEVSLVFSCYSNITFKGPAAPDHVCHTQPAWQ